MKTEALLPETPQRIQTERAPESGRPTAFAAAVREPVDGMSCRLGGASSAKVHASTLDRSSMQGTLLRLQRQFGNRYVGQVLDRVHDGGSGESGLASVERSIEQAHGSGQGLDHRVRSQMEGAFRADFGGVRVHTDARADSLTEALNARAFATGRDVFFRQGEYSPGSSSGRELLAHELTHVVQQSGAGIRRKMTVSEPDDPQEVEADQMARAVMQREQRADDPLAVTGEKDEDEDNISPKLANRDAAPAMPGAVVQRDLEGAPTVNPPTPLPAAGSTTAVPPVGVPATVPATVPADPAKELTTPITFTAIAEDIAGTAKDRVKAKEADDALWFDPLNVHSDTPLVKKSRKSIGVLAGSGAQLISTFPVPVTEGPGSHGSGTVTARLKYADSATKSFDVKVAGPKKITAAQKAARKYIEEEMTVFGDIGELQTGTATELERQGFGPSTVSITINTNRTKDVGETSFFYLARNRPQILMRITTAKVGEKKTTSSGSTTDTKDVKTDDEAHHDSSKETVDVEYSKSVVKTLDDKVKSVETVRTELISKLTDVIVDNDDYNKTDTTKTVTVPGTYEDYTKKVKGYSEEGDKEKSNWAAKGRKVIGIAKDVISIPGIDNIKGVGKVTRFLKGWQLDLVDKALGLFAEEGKVHFKDSTEDTTIHKEKGGKDTTTTTNEVVIKSGSKSDRKRDLKETFTSKSEADWSRYKKETEDIKERYGSVTKKDAEGGSSRRTTAVQQSTTASFTTATTWVLSKPVVEAAVVAGDGEVANVPFKEAPPPAADTK